jgi:hypothetical protein
MKKLLFVCAIAILGFGRANAQDLEPADHGCFNHLAAGITLGTDGIGVEVAAPLTYQFSVRAGFEFMPKFKYKKTENLGKDPAFVNYPNDQEIDLEGKVNLFQGKLLFDYYPFAKSSFHLTAGAYFGSSDVVKVTNRNNFVEPSQWGTAGLQLGKGDGVYDKYTAVTDDHGNLDIKMRVNGFRPYLGVGFGRAIPSKHRVGVQFDLGVQFWGKPKVMGHLMYFDSNEGDFVTRYEDVNTNRITNMKDDYQDIKDMIQDVKKIYVYPVLNIRINGRIF